MFLKMCTSFIKLSHKNNSVKVTVTTCKQELMNAILCCHASRLDPDAELLKSVAYKNKAPIPLHYILLQKDTQISLLSDWRVAELDLLSLKKWRARVHMRGSFCLNANLINKFHQGSFVLCARMWETVTNCTRFTVNCSLDSSEMYINQLDPLLRQNTFYSWKHPGFTGEKKQYSHSTRICRKSAITLLLPTSSLL